MEWPHTLDVDALLADGWTPRPFRSFILKIHGRCDLACDYCYFYRGADQSWRAQPRTMSRAVVEQTARRVAEHVRAHRLPRVNVVLHGGEPLLATPGLTAYAVRTIREQVGTAAEVRVSVQTNGLRLDDERVRLFAELGVRIGVSLDGDRDAHDRHRRTPGGRGTFERVAAAVHRLSAGPHRRLFAGLLCTIDLRNDPVRTYEALLRFQPPAVDFLLPHGNWNSPPPRRLPGSPDTPYGDWLIAVFDRWYDAAAKETGIRLFEEIINLLCGGVSTVEGIGLAPIRYLVIETDGSIGQGDALKVAYPGAPWTGFHVETTPFDAALFAAPFVARQIGVAALGPTCRGCGLHRVCGAGHYAHRYRAGDGFANPTVYCPDLYKLITHVRARVAADVLRPRG